MKRICRSESSIHRVMRSRDSIDDGFCCACPNTHHATCSINTKAKMDETDEFTVVCCILGVPLFLLVLLHYMRIGLRSIATLKYFFQFGGKRHKSGVLEQESFVSSRI